LRRLAQFILFLLAQVRRKARHDCSLLPMLLWTCYTTTGHKNKSHTKLVCRNLLISKVLATSTTETKRTNHTLCPQTKTKIAIISYKNAEMRINMLYIRWPSIVNHHRRSQDFLWGCTIFLKKADDLFLVVALKRRFKTY